MESRELMATCQTLDTATTLYALHLGAVETNGFVAFFTAHPALFVIMKGALTWWMWTSWDEIDPPIKVTINVISCYPVPGNIRTIRQQKAINAGSAP